MTKRNVIDKLREDLDELYRTTWLEKPKSGDS